MSHEAELLLVIANDEQRRTELVRRLARAGHAVREAASVAAALALARTDPPTLIVLATNGAQPDPAAIQRLRATSPTAAIVILPPAHPDTRASAIVCGHQTQAETLVAAWRQLGGHAGLAGHEPADLHQREAAESNDAGLVLVDNERAELGDLLDRLGALPAAPVAPRARSVRWLVRWLADTTLSRQAAGELAQVLASAAHDRSLDPCLRWRARVWSARLVSPG